MEDYFKYNILVMNQIGSWPLPNIRRTEILKRCLAFFSIALYFLEAVSIWWAVYDNRKDIFIVVEGVLEGLLMIQSTIKMLSFIIRRDFLRELISLLVDLRINTPLDVNNEKLVNSTEKWKKQAHLWVQLVVASFAVPMVVFVSLPWIKYYMYGVKTIFFLSKFQDDYMEWKYYILLDLNEVVTAWSCIILNVTGETFFATIVMFLCSRLDIMEYTIEKATNEAIEFKQTTKLFGSCVEYHKKILRVCDMLENFYSPMLILQFLGSTVSICITSFLAMQKSSVIDKGLSFKLYLIGILLELFVYCYFGQLLQTKFEDLEITAAYQPWYEAPLSYQKDLKFFLARCLKPVTLTAYKFSPVNLESFFSICKASASYYAILRSFTEDET